MRIEAMISLLLKFQVNRWSYDRQHVHDWLYNNVFDDDRSWYRKHKIKNPYPERIDINAGLWEFLQKRGVDYANSAESLVEDFSKQAEKYFRAALCYFLAALLAQDDVTRFSLLNEFQKYVTMISSVASKQLEQCKQLAQSYFEFLKKDRPTNFIQNLIATCKLTQLESLFKLDTEAAIGATASEAVPNFPIAPIARVIQAEKVKTLPDSFVATPSVKPSQETAVEIDTQTKQYTALLIGRLRAHRDLIVKDCNEAYPGFRCQRLSDKKQATFFKLFGQLEQAKSLYHCRQLLVVACKDKDMTAQRYWRGVVLHYLTFTLFKSYSENLLQYEINTLDEHVTQGFGL